MKRITTILTFLMLMCMGAVAATSITVDTEHPLTSVSQISTDKYYVLYNQGRKQYININPATGQVLMTGSLPTSSDAALLPYIVRFVSNTSAKSDGTAYQLKFYDGTFMQWITVGDSYGHVKGGSNYVSTTMGYNSDNEGFLPVYNDSYFYFQVYKGGTSRDYYFNGNSGAFTFWNNYGENGEYQIYEATCSDFQEISYNYAIGGSATDNAPRKLLTVKSATVAVPTATAMTSLPQFTSIASAPTASADGSGISFTLTENYPFLTTTLVAGAIPASAPLFRLKGNVGNTPTYIKRSGDAVVYKADETVDADDYFCFTGNIIDGFRIYNKGAGTDVNLGSDTPAEGTSPALTSSDHVWRLYKNGDDFGFQQLKTGNTSLSNAYLCNVGYKFTYWLSNYAESWSDGGAKMACERATFDVTEESYVRLPEGAYSLKNTKIATYNSGEAYVHAGLPTSAALSFDEVVDDPSYVSEAVTVKYYYTASDAVINVGPSTGTYYLANGTIITKGDDKYGPTWKSDEIVDEKPLLTLQSETGTGMSAKYGNIYTNTSGAAQRFTLTAAEGYVITSYTINGTAKGTNVTITPRIRKGETVTEDAALATALSVTGLDLNSTSFTLSGANSTNGYLSDLSLSVTLAVSSTKSYTPPVENGTLAQIGYKHIATGKARTMLYMKDDGGAVVSANQVSTTLDEAPSETATYLFVYNSDDRAYYLKEPLSGKYLYARDIAMSTNLSSGDKGVLAVGSLPVSGDKSVYQWTIETGGEYVDQMTYYIHPKLNTSTSIAAYGDTKTYFSFHDATPTRYDFAHAFLVSKTWKDVTDAYWGVNGVEAKLSKAGKAGYPKLTNEHSVSLNSIKTYLAGSPVYSESLYNTLVDSYNGYLTTSDITIPATGYYRLKSYYNKYMYTENGTIYGNNTSNEGPSTIVRLENNGDNTVNIQLQGSYFQTPTQSDDVTRGASAVAFTVGYVSFGVVTLKAGNGTYGALHTSATQSYKVVGWASSSEASRWSIEEASELGEGAYALKVNLTNVGDYAYATLCLPFAAMTYTEGVNAYTLESGNVAANEATFTKIDGGVIPAGTPVLLRGNSGTEKAELTIASDASYVSAPLTTTLLTGIFTNKDISSTKGTDYYLGIIDGNIGFYHWDGNTLSANRAYLPAANVPAAASRGFAIKWNDDVTGIDDATHLKQKAESRKQMFDLQGRRVENPQRGLYIVGGRKIVIK